MALILSGCPAHHCRTTGERIQAMDGRYVVGVDGSSPSAAALRWAKERAMRDQAPLVLVHVRDPEAGMMGEDFARDEARRSSELISRLMEELAPSGLDCSATVLEGPMTVALADFVTAQDVVVIGTHKVGFLHGRVLGSRSVQIAAGVPCSVAVIPEVDLRFRRAVVAGVDRRDTAAEIARVAAAEAEARGEDLLIIQAELPAGRPRHDLPVTIAVAAARDSFPSLVVRSRVSARPAAEALLDAARDKGLLVIGPGATGPYRSPIGSVLHDVLLNVNAPVLVCRPVVDRELVLPAMV
jgi:nucleotide-binding universal stress UspA family protein